MARVHLLLLALCCWLGGERAVSASFLFDAAHAQTAGNADWVIDADSGPQRFPTPDQATVTANTPETYWHGGISAWAIDLVKRGHSVQTLPPGGVLTYLSGSNAQDLSHYQVLVVDEPNKAFTTAEKAAIVNWVRAGGSLFMVADHVGSDRNGDGKDSVAIWNELFSTNGVQSAPFGVVFNSDSVSPRNESADATLTNPLTHGVAGTITQFVYADGASITINPSANASVKAAVWTTSTHTNTNVMVAYGSFGAGKFVAIGDSSPADDGTGASGDTLYDGWTAGGGDNGQLIINASLWLAAGQTVNVPPVNDNFATPSVITGATLHVSGSNANGTKEAGEPNHGGDAGGASIWWGWTAPSSGTVVIDTIGSNIDTTLGIYTGSTVNALTTVASDNDSGGALASKVSYAVTAGVSYAIAVDGVAGAMGGVVLNLVLTPPPIGGTATSIGSWNFDTTPFGATIAPSAGSGIIDLSGWGGTVTNFNGVSGQSLALQQGSSGNGTYIEIDFSMTGYRELSVTFSTRGTSTGFNVGTWSWSVNGSAFSTLPGVNTATTSTTFAGKSVDFSAITVLDNAAAVRLRYTLSGASGSTANNRIDDLVLNATLTPTVSLVVTTADAYEKESVPGSVTVSSSLAAGAGGLAISYQLGGTATAPGSAGPDYALTGPAAAGVVTIPEGGTSATIGLIPVADSNPLEFDEEATVSLQAGTGYFLGTASAGTVTIHDDTPFTAEWASQFSGLGGAAAAPLADPDGDGVPNLLEFAFDADPLRAQVAKLPVAGTATFPDPLEGNFPKQYPTITFLRRTDAPDLVYSVEVATTLGTWTNDVEQVSVTPTVSPNVELVVYRALVPLSGADAARSIYLRVRCVGAD